MQIKNNPAQQIQDPEPYSSRDGWEVVEDGSALPEQDGPWEVVDEPAQPEHVYWQSTQFNPDEMAEVESLSRKLQSNATSVKLDLDGARKAANSPNFTRMREETPALSQRATQPRFMGQAQDDTEALTEIEKRFQEMSPKEQVLRSLANVAGLGLTRTGGPAGFIPGQLLQRYGRGAGMQTQDNEDRSFEEDIYASIARGVIKETPEMGLRAANAFTGGSASRYEDEQSFLTDLIGEFTDLEQQPYFRASNAEGLQKAAYEGFQSLPPSLLYGGAASLPGLAVGGPLGAILSFGAGAGTVFGGSEYDRTMEEAKEQNVDLDDAKTTALISGVAEGALEGMSDILSLGLMKAFQPAVKGAFSTAGQTAKTLLKNYALTLASEAPTEASTSAVQAWARERVQMDALPPMEAAVKSLLPTMFASVGFSGVGTMTTLQQVQAEESVERIAGAVGQSKLYERNPDLFKEFLGDLQKQYGSLPPALYLDTAKARDLFYAEDGFAETLGLDEDDMESRLQEDQDIRIPISNIFDLHQRSDWDELKESLKTSPFVPQNLDDASVMQQVQELFQRAETLSEPAEQFRQRLVEINQEDPKAFRKKHGVTPKEFADTQARVVDAFARVWAETTGRTPEEYWQRRGFNLQAGGEGELNQSNFKSLNDLRQDWKEGTFDPNDPRILYQDGQTGPTFYSQMQAVLDKNLPGKGTAGQYLQTIQSWAKKGQFKQEELDWSGLEDWLGSMGKKEKLTKGQVLDFLRDNEIEIEEIAKTKGVQSSNAEFYSEDERWGDEPAEFDSVGDAVQFAMEVFGNTEEEARDFVDETNELEESSRGGEEDTRYGNQQLPGGENYQELLLTLPPRFVNPEEEALNRYGKPFNQLTEQQQSAVQKQIQKVLHDGYQSSHWDEPNVLAHVRFNERTDADGNRVLFIEEVQSDWHQEGRKKGYKGERQAEYDALEKEWDDLHPLMAQGDENAAARMREIEAQVAEMPENRLGAVPDAPFKTTWPQLAMKRMLRYAAENGFDAVAWPGTAEQVATIEGWGGVYQKDNGKWELKNEKDVTPIVNRYLQDIPRFLNKYTKKWKTKTVQAEVSGFPVHALPVTEAMRDAALAGQPLFQKDSDAKRGAISFDATGQAAISIFEGQDLSTVLHEVGHVFRRDLEEMASLEDAPEQVRQDWQTVLDWVGAQDGNWSREQEEQFAEAWEQYFMEGSAPVPALKRVFARFRKWLMAVYKGARRSYKLNDEVRRVFDRMLATQEEIEWAQNQLMVDPSFAPDDMAPEDWAEYERLANAADREASEKAARQRLHQWRKQQAQWRREAKELADDHPVVQIRKRLREGDGLNIDTLKQDYDAETIKELQRKMPGALKSGGLEPDLVADSYGQEYDDFIVSLQETPTRAELEQQFYEQIEANAHAETEGRLDEFIFGDDRLKLLDYEIELLAKKLGWKKPPTSRDIAKLVRRKVREGRYTNLENDTDTLLAALQREGKASREAAREARKEGKQEAWAQALEAKQKQRMKAVRLREERRAKERADTIRRKLARWLKLKTIDPEYKEQLADLLQSYDLTQQSKRTVEKRQSLREFIEAHQENGEQVDIPPSLQEKAYKIHPKEMSLEDLEQLHDAAESIVHLGRLKKKLVAQKEARDFEQVKSELINRAYASHKIKNDLPGIPPPSAREKSPIQQLYDNGHGWLADLRRMEFILQALDGSYRDTNDPGPWHQYIFQTINQAELAELEWMEEIGKQLESALKPVRDMGRTELQRKTRFEGWPDRNMLSREEQIMIALNWGNEGNRDAVRYGYGLIDQQYEQRFGKEAAKVRADAVVQKVLDSLTKQEWDMVQQIWDLLDSMYPRLNEAHKTLMGGKLKRVEAAPVETLHGRYAGGYFPLIFDGDVSYKAEMYQTKAEASALFETVYPRPKTESGHRQERKGGKMTPLLSLDVLTRHVTRAVHDATHAVAVRDVYKIMQDPDIRQAVIDTHGKDVFDQMKPWLQYVAKPERPLGGKLDKTIRWLRQNTTIAMLGANVGTMIAQPMSLTQTVDAIGFAPTVKGFASFLANPRQAIKMVDEKSVQMRNRRSTWQREIAEMFQTLSLKRGKIARATKEAQQFAMYGITLGDFLGSYPSWLAAYSVAEQQGKTGQEAVDFADRIVRSTQPASGSKDLSKLQRGSEMEKAVSMFISFFNVFYNRTYRHMQGRMQGQLSSLDLAKSYLWLVAMPSVLMQVFKYRGDLDEEFWTSQWWKDQLSFAARMLPLVRDLVNAMVTGFDYQLTPMSEAGTTVTRFVNELTSDDPEIGDALKYGTELTGYALGLPTRQAVKVAEALMALEQGKTKDYLRPLYGKKREDWGE